jgi:hypothetical protein
MVMKEPNYESCSSDELHNILAHVDLLPNQKEDLYWKTSNGVAKKA